MYSRRDRNVSLPFLRHFSQRLQRFRAQVGEFASVDDQSSRTSRHETQATRSPNTAATSVNDEELATPLSFDNRPPSGEDLINLKRPNHECSSPIRRSTKAGGNQPSNHLPANDTTTLKTHPTSVGDGSPSPDSLQLMVALSPPLGTRDNECPGA